MMADIYQAKILVPSVLEEASSMGGAITGGVGAGLYKDFSISEKFLEIQEIHEADSRASRKYKERKEVFDACYFALEHLYHKL